MAKGARTRTTQKKQQTSKKVVSKPRKTALSHAKKSIPPKAQKKKVTQKTATSKSAQKTKVKAVHKKKTATKLALNKLTSRTVDEKNARQTTKKVLIPSPYRFPLDIHALARATARFGGVAFVVLGAIFTLHYANALFFTSSDSYALTSNVINVQDVTSAVCATANDCLLEKLALDTIQVNIPDEILVKTVPIELSVANATQVRVSAYSKTQKREFELGRMTNTTDTDWKFSWNTKKYNDGDYTLKFFIKNNDDATEYSDKKLYTIANNPLIAAVVPVEPSATNVKKQVSLQDATSTEDVSIPKEVNAHIVLSAKTETPLDEVVSLMISANDAQKVKVYLINKTGETKKLLGYALQSKQGTWSYAWNTKTYDEGAYVLIAQAVLSDTTVQSEELAVVIEHESSQLDENVVTQVLDTVPIEEVQNPDIITSVLPGSPTTQAREMQIEAVDAKFVEVYAMNERSAIRSYLGNAQQAAADVWSYTLDTNKLPNGAYKIAAKVKNDFGIFESFSEVFSIAHEQKTVQTSAQTERITQLTEIATEEVKLQQQKTELQTNSTEQTEIADGTKDSNAATSSNARYDTLLSVYKDDTAKVLAKLAFAVRSQDTNAIALVKAEINQLKTTLKNTPLGTQTTEQRNVYINQKIDTAVAETEEAVQRTNKIISERTNAAASTDSDADGITDFDEIHLFSTDPFSADSDNDGYVDGVEVLNGYDPTNAESESAVVFQSPKESGVLRDDILVVEAIVPAVADEVSTEGQKQPPQAIISGKALPNSYVTLYIFSTPIVITVKTDADGSWYYKFDKELDDGEHEVYVGITDNAGKLVAKSNPLVFVKEAEAFNEVDGTPTVSFVSQTDTTDSFMSLYMIYLILSLSVVSIGLVLILLGMYLNRRDHITLVEREPSTI